MACVLDAHRAQGCAVTVPEYRGKGGHPIALSASLLPELQAIDEQSQGIKAVVRRRPDSVHRFPLDNPEILLDLNTARAVPRRRGGGWELSGWRIQQHSIVFLIMGVRKRHLPRDTDAHEGSPYTMAVSQ